MPQSLVKRCVQSASSYIEEHHSQLGIALFLIPALTITLVLTETACALARLFG